MGRRKKTSESAGVLHLKDRIPTSGQPAHIDMENAMGPKRVCGVTASGIREKTLV